MIFFTDKSGSAYSIEQPEQFLSKRALQRRLDQNIKITSLDLPVSEQYLDALSTQPLQVYFATKWMNGVLVEMDESELQNIQTLSFVEDVELVAHGSKMNNQQNGLDSNYTNWLFSQLKDVF